MDYNEKQQKYYDMLKFGEDDIIGHTDITWDGFRYDESIDYDEHAIKEKFPQYTEEYLDRKIQEGLEDYDRLQYYWDDTEETLSSLSLDVLEIAEKKGLISSCKEKKKNSKGHEYTVWQRNFKTSDYGYDILIKMEWTLPRHADDLQNDYDDIIGQIENEEYDGLGRNIFMFNRDMRRNNRAIDFIQDAEKYLENIFKGGYDITEEIINDIESDEEAELIEEEFDTEKEAA